MLYCNAVPCLLRAALYNIESAIVLPFKRLRCQVTILPEILNSLSTAHPDAGTARTSLAILANSGNGLWLSRHHFNNDGMLASFERPLSNHFLIFNIIMKSYLS